MPGLGEQRQAVRSNSRDHQQSDVNQRQNQRKAEHTGDAARALPGRGLEMRVTVGVGMHSFSLRGRAARFKEGSSPAPLWETIRSFLGSVLNFSCGCNLAAM